MTFIRQSNISYDSIDTEARAHGVASKNCCLDTITQSAISIVAPEMSGVL